MDTTTTLEPDGTSTTTPQQQQQQQIRRTTLDGCWILDKTRENWSMNEYLQIMNVDPLAIEAHEKGEKEHDTFHTIEFIPSSTSSSSNRNLLLEPYDRIKIIKRSRVNNDVVVDLILGQEYQQILQPNDRLKSSIATSNHLGTYLCIQSSLVTTDNHGTAIVTDIKRLVEPDNTTLSTTNDTKDDNTTTETTMNDNVMTDNTTNIDEQTDQTKIQKVQYNDVVMVQELTILNQETGKSHTTTRYFLPYYDTPPHLVPPPPPPISTSLDDTDMMDE